MKTYEDFDFSSTLTLEESLQRLKNRTAGKYASFSGTVAGNQFFLSHEGDDKSTYEDDPQLTGYIARWKGFQGFRSCSSGGANRMGLSGMYFYAVIDWGHDINNMEFNQ